MKLRFDQELIPSPISTALMPIILILRKRHISHPAMIANKTPNVFDPCTIFGIDI